MKVWRYTLLILLSILCFPADSFTYPLDQGPGETRKAYAGRSRQRGRRAAYRRRLAARRYHQALARRRHARFLAQRTTHRLRARKVASRTVATPPSRRPVATVNLADIWRGESKTSVARTPRGSEIPVETCSNLEELIGTLPLDKEIRVRYGIYEGSRSQGQRPRFEEERRVVRVTCWIHAIRRDTTDRNESDIQIILGSTNQSVTSKFIMAELPVPGPWRDESLFDRARAQLAGLIPASTSAPSSTYQRVEPISITIEGSLLFDGIHGAGKRSDPGPEWAKPLTVWEIHPVSAIVTSAVSGR